MLANWNTNSLSFLTLSSKKEKSESKDGEYFSVLFRKPSRDQVKKIRRAGHCGIADLFSSAIREHLLLGVKCQFIYS